MSGPQTNLKRKRFGRLIVIRQSETEERPQNTSGLSVYWYCRCDCGNYKHVKGEYLRNGGALSCGCFQIENRKRKGRWRIRSTVCQICGREFEYNSSITPKTCSRKCWKRFQADRSRKGSNATIENKVMCIVRASKRKNIRNGILNDLTKEFIMDLLKKQGNRCAKTKIPLEVREDTNNSGLRSPWQPSVDQINPGKGYTKGNIQIVCLIYNFCKNIWTHGEVVQFSKAVLQSENKKVLVKRKRNIRDYE